jgi:hypothetical protein
LTFPKGKNQPARRLRWALSIFFGDLVIVNKLLEKKKEKRKKK